MSIYVTELATLMAIFSFVIVSPGADLAMVLRQSVVHGRRAAIVTSFGLGISLLFHISYTILGLGMIISKSILLFNIVKWCGVAYLVYIGIKALRAGSLTTEKTPPQDRAFGPEQKPVAEQGLIKAFVLGFATNALNPKPVFFFLSVFATVVSVHTPAMVRFGYGLVMDVRRDANPVEQQILPRLRLPRRGKSSSNTNRKSQPCARRLAIACLCLHRSAGRADDEPAN